MWRWAGGGWTGVAAAELRRGSVVAQEKASELDHLPARRSRGDLRTDRKAANFLPSLPLVSIAEDWPPLTGAAGAGSLLSPAGAAATDAVPPTPAAALTFSMLVRSRLMCPFFAPIRRSTD